jgi:hypothetical protein
MIGQQLGSAFYWDRVYVCVRYPIESRWEFRSESTSPEFWAVADHVAHVQELLLPRFNAQGLAEFPLVGTWRADPGSFWVFEGWRSSAPGCGQ